MKKVLEGELLSIAHRILQMKDKDVTNLLTEAKNLYEKLLILQFYQDCHDKGLEGNTTNETFEADLTAYYANKSFDQKDESDRHQMPIDLVEEDYPIVIESEKEGYLSNADEVISDIVQKIAPEILHDDIPTTFPIEYSTDLSMGPAIVESENEDKAELHRFLDEQEETLDEVVSSDVTVDQPQLVVNKEEVANTKTEDNNTIITGDDLKVEEDVVQVISTKDEIHHLIHSQVEIDKAQVEVDLPKVVKEEAIVADRIVPVDDSISPLKREEDPFSGFNFMDLDFKRVDDTSLKAEEAITQVNDEDSSLTTESEKEEAKEDQSQNTLFNLESMSVKEPRISKSKSINDIYNSSISVGLNDRIAFEKHLFGGSAEDFNRVLSQLNTVSNFDEAMSLIEHLVKPEYNNWEGKEEYEERFVAIVEKRFI
ncbi:MULTISPECIES: hypothetical protein [Myroides]|uniref:Uncharacterized protein n=1 Tax=Myroides albus TaxID=2562892 RepID=A0A6I3LBB8_9FLAO|nr:MULTISPECIES: hypothetical protein [Myroides]MTG96749.1 hypothetical protein [Myroides albus]MVX35609.1 hypothetical protein [Myroides sp. LoEW2-1]UVD80840.1 hypothetical protein NWE55_06250 [Myroides albus]